MESAPSIEKSYFVSGVSQIMYFNKVGKPLVANTGVSQIIYFNKVGKPLVANTSVF